MVYVTTAVYKEYGAQGDQNPEHLPSWRVQSCRIELGPDHEPLTFSSDWVYGSAEAAHDDMRTQALERLRLTGYTGSEADIVWRLHKIG